VKVSTNRQELVDWVESLKVPSYSEDGWQKSFQKGSELEWYNPPHNLEKDNDFWGGIYTFKDEAPDEAIMDFALIKG